MFGKIGHKVAETIAPKIAKSVGGEIPDNTQVKGNIYGNEVDDAVVDQAIVDAAPERTDQYVNPARTSHRNFSLEYINTSDDVLKYMDDLSENIGDEIGAKSKNVQTHDQTLSKADNEISTNGDYSLEDILNSGRYINRKPGNWTTSQLTAGRKMLVQGAEELHEMASYLATKSEAEITDTEIYGFRKNMATYQALKRSVEGGVNEAARIVNSMRIPVGSPEAMGMQVQEKLNELGGRDVGLKMARRIALTGGDAKQVSDITDKFSMSNVADAMFEHWLGFGLLSDPMTHKVNLTGNTGAMVLGVGEAYAATAVGKARQLVLKAAGKPDADIQYHTLDQANAYAYGMMQAIPNMWSTMSKTFKESDDAAMGVGREMNSVKTGATHSPKWKAETFGIDSNTKLGKTIDWWGKNVTRMSFRLLESEDEAFKMVAKNMERNRLVYRHLESEGIKPGTEEFNQRAQSIIAGTDPVYSAQVDDASDAWARYQTFTDEADDALTRGASNIANARIMGVPFMKGFIPFIKITTNLTTYSLERTPIAVLMPKWREQFNKGGADRDIAVAKVGIGALATWQINEMMTGMKVDDDGNMVPSPTLIGAGNADWASNKTRQLATGVSPHSVIIGDKSHNFSRLSPVGQSISNIATTLEMINGLYSEEDKNLFLATVAVGVGEAMSDQTFMRGMSDFFTIMGSGGQSGGKVQMLENKLSSDVASFFVPNVVNRVRKDGIPFVLEGDDKIRQKKHDDFWQSVQLKIADRLPSTIAGRFINQATGLPFQGSQDIPLKYTPLGEPMLNDEMGWSKWSPLTLSQWTMLRQPYESDDNNIFLNSLQVGYNIPDASPKLTIKLEGGRQSVDVDLNLMDMELEYSAGESYSKWAKLLGETKKAEFNDLLSSKKWNDAEIQSKDRNGRYELMRDANRRATEKAKKIFLRENKEDLNYMAELNSQNEVSAPAIPEGIDSDELYKVTGDMKL